LFGSGSGLFPVEIGQPGSLAESSAQEDLFDIQAEPHPVFDPLLSSAGSPFRMLRIQRYIEATVPKSIPSDATVDQSAANNSNSPNATADTSAATNSNSQPKTNPVQIVAKLRNGKPLILDRAFGEGRVMAVMTSLLPTWSSWAQHPTFVVFALRSVGYLGSFKRPEVGVPSGTPWSEEISLQTYLPELEFLVPAGSGGTRLPIKSIAKADSAKSEGELELKGVATLSVFAENLSEDLIHQLLSPGVIEAWRTDITGNREVHNRSFYAPPSEGDLRKLAPSELIATLRPVSVKHRYAENLANNMLTAGLVNRDNLLMALLIGLLLLEQALAYWASFHPPARKGAVA
jgi:hypothetical protein